MTPICTKLIIKDTRRNPNLSQREWARKLGTTRDIVVSSLKREGIQAYHVVKVPNRNEKQCQVAKTRLRKPYDDVIKKHKGCILMDDETYIYGDTAQIKRDDNEKFAKKFLIWQGVCTCGLKTRTIVIEGNLSAKDYINKCLLPVIIPFIERHDGPVIFWPDLASCHYAWKSSRAMTFNTYRDYVTHQITQRSGPSRDTGHL